MVWSNRLASRSKRSAHGLLRFVATALIALLSASCAQPVFVCEPTVAHMTPPEQVLNFFASGSTDPDAKEKLAPMNWYGNDAMWVILPPGGEMVGRLFDKIPPYRMRYGTVFWQARRLDGAAIATRSL